MGITKIYILYIVLVVGISPLFSLPGETCSCGVSSGRVTSGWMLGLRVAMPKHVVLKSTYPSFDKHGGLVVTNHSLSVRAEQDLRLIFLLRDARLCIGRRPGKGGPTAAEFIATIRAEPDLFVFEFNNEPGNPQVMQTDASPNPAAHPWDQLPAPPDQVTQMQISGVYCCSSMEVGSKAFVTRGYS